MVTDTIGDFINRLTTATAVRKATVTMPFSKLKHQIALVLKREGYLGEISESKGEVGKTLTVELIYDPDGEPRIHGAKRLSKPGRRLYAPVHTIHPIKNGKGCLVLTTPRGIMTDKDARRDRVGGETMFTIW
ncbi:MAG: 30S ribosomal protein S8 [Candidatus Pacebacteria bacterium]|jgi:small subunit ribosomal protein S8|nr:30S ribosomal protein S8 [Candidatus Paceibacterota bacterium]